MLPSELKSALQVVKYPLSLKQYGDFTESMASPIINARVWYNEEHEFRPGKFSILVPYI